MGKRLKTYRIDEVLDDAVTAEAAKRGEPVTQVIVRALEAYIAGGLDIQAAGSEAPFEPAVYQPAAAPVVKPAGSRRRDEPESAADIAAFFTRRKTT